MVAGAKCGKNMGTVPKNMGTVPMFLSPHERTVPLCSQSERSQELGEVFDFESPRQCPEGSDSHITDSASSAQQFDDGGSVETRSFCQTVNR